MNIKEEILEHTNRGLEIFCFYMPIDFVPKRNFRNPLYKDKRASCNIYLDTKSQCYRMKDFGNEAYSGDCFLVCSNDAWSRCSIGFQESLIDYHTGFKSQYYHGF